LFQRVANINENPLFLKGDFKSLQFLNYSKFKSSESVGSRSYSPFKAYHPKIINPTDIGTNMKIIITHTMGLLISLVPAGSIFSIAPAIRKYITTGPNNSQSTPSILFIAFMAMKFNFK